MSYLNMLTSNFFIHPNLGASGNTGKGFYKVTVTSGGTTTPTVYTHYIKGMTSNATAVITYLTTTSGTWAGGNWAGTIHISESTGTFTDGETLGLYLCTDDTQVSADVATLGTGTYAVDSFGIIDHSTAAKGLATTAPINAIAKSPAPTSLGVTASVTKLSRTVTLASAVNLTVNDCNATTGWTGYNSATITSATTASYRKEGGAANTITPPATPSSNTKYAVYVISTGSDTDYSAWQQINFWFRPSSSTDGLKWVIKLCSDEAGDTAVHTFALDKVTTNGQFIPYVFDNGSSLGTNIRSLAIYSGASTPSANTITIDNIFLSKAPSAADSLTLKSLISFSSADNVQDNAWYPVKSVSGTTVMIDNHPNADYNTGRGFSEDTVTSQTLYKRECFTKFTNTSSTTAVQTTQVAGTNGTYIQYQGGVNTKTLVQEGYTFYCGDNGWGYGITEISAANYQLLNRLGFVRYNYPLYFVPGDKTVLRIDDVTAIGSPQYIWIQTCYQLILNGYMNSFNCGANATSSGIDFRTTNLIATNNSRVKCNGSGWGLAFINNASLNVVTTNNNTNYGIGLATGISDIRIKTFNSRDNGTASIRYALETQLAIETSNITDSTELSFSMTKPYFGIAYLGNLGGTANNHQVVFPAGRAYMQASEKPSDVSFAWKLSPTSNIYRSWTPLMLRISPEGGFYVEASKQVTIKARIKVSNANITGGILVPALQAGLTADQVVTSVSTNATWGEEVTLQFTPPAAGAIEIFFIAYYPDTSATHTYSAYLAAPVDVGGVYTMFTQAT